MQNVTISRTDGLNFNLGQFRIAEGRNTNSGFFVHSAKTVTITGLTDAGGTVNNYFNLDLIASENSLLDFQDVLLSGFTNLVSVSFTGSGGLPSGANQFSLDDITLTAAVPEPSSLAVVSVLATLSLGRFMSRRGRSSLKSTCTT
jgi:hypothetical protein